jgi:hypothetical protein
MFGSQWSAQGNDWTNQWNASIGLVWSAATCRRFCVSYCRIMINTRISEIASRMSKHAALLFSAVSLRLCAGCSGHQAIGQH